MNTILTRDVFQIGQLGGTDNNFILAGTTLQNVQLTTSEPANDANFLTTGEAVTFSINGTTVLSTAPVFNEVRLETNVGRIDGFVFQAGGTAYFIPELPAAALVNVTQVVGSSALLAATPSIDTAVTNFEVAGATTFNSPERSFALAPMVSSRASKTSLVRSLPRLLIRMGSATMDPKPA